MPNFENNNLKQYIEFGIDLKWISQDLESDNFIPLKWVQRNGNSIQIYNFDGLSRNERIKRINDHDLLVEILGDKNNVSEVDKVQVKITVEFDSDEKDIVASATEEVSEVVETEQITNTTQEVQQIVETASVADTVSSSTEQIENVVENTQITEQISDAQKRMLDFGIFDADGGITGNMNKIDILSDAGGLLTYDEIQTLETSIQDRIVDLANSAGRFDIITGETQARLMCEQGNIGADNYVTINGTSGNMQGELSQPEGKWRCDKF